MTAPSLRSSSARPSSLARCLAPLAAALLLPLAGCQSDDSGGSTYNSGSTPVATSLGGDSLAALAQLRSQNPGVAALADRAKGILVFPNMVKGGLIVGGFHGEGTLIQNGRITGYYDSSGASYGLQAGIQRYGYALFFMRDEDMNYLNDSRGWEIGSGPTITVLDSGASASLTTTTAREGVYCYFFDQRGLMAGLSLQGSKITRIYK